MGIKYDPQIQVIVDNLTKADSFKLNNETLEQVRSYMKQSGKNGEKVPVESIEDKSIPRPHGSIPIRIYKPTCEKNKILPILVYYHGGGFVMGDIESSDSFCRRLVNASKSIVVSVEYRLAPENKFPVPLNDSFAAYTWVYENAENLGGHKKKLVVVGESAGAALAAIIAIKVKETPNLDLSAQVLFYPPTGVGFTKSYQLYGENDPILPNEQINWMRECHRNSIEDIENPYYNPYKHPDVSGVAPAFIVTAQYDPLLDDGFLYANKLKEAAVETIYKVYEGMIHGFVSMNGIDKSSEALNDSCKFLNNIFNLYKENV